MGHLKKWNITGSLQKTDNKVRLYVGFVADR